MEDNKFDKQELKPGEMVIEPGGDEYELVPEGEPLKFHVDSVNTVMGKNFTTGEPEKKLAVGFKLDEDITGKGQVYTQWLTPSISERANLTKVAKAIFGEVPVPLDPTSLTGMPLRITLKNKKRDDGTVRQHPDSYLKPATGQKKVEKDVVVTDVEEGEDPLADINF